MKLFSFIHSLNHSSDSGVDNVIDTDQLLQHTDIDVYNSYICDCGGGELFKSSLKKKCKLGLLDCWLGKVSHWVACFDPVGPPTDWQLNSGLSRQVVGTPLSDSWSVNAHLVQIKIMILTYSLLKFTPPTGSLLLLKAPATAGNVWCYFFILISTLSLSLSGWVFVYSLLLLLLFSNTLQHYHHHHLNTDRHSISLSTITLI